MITSAEQPDPLVDLVLKRDFPCPPTVLWDAWTHEEQLAQWFGSERWQLETCQLQLCPSGAFDLVLCSPRGRRLTHHGCFVDIRPAESLAWTTDLYLRPARARARDVPRFTAAVRFEARAHGCSLTVVVMHADAADRAASERFGVARFASQALERLAQYLDPSATACVGMRA